MAIVRTDAAPPSLIIAPCRPIFTPVIPAKAGTRKAANRNGGERFALSAP